ncbi:flagellin N-terminal helical domain-containing protein [Clostridium septicum]|uniref:Flagellin n=1 Tax=Clostridium septicum TaxID=1504 RepID=A0A9N7PKF2_CLOSE|nr:flagellin [Clostridium septicum]AYE33436.1 flagellin [Clostridium septicum]QAS61610.1 flagellin [Clostridium septicum]UEC21954.1 flagellin [Clostridium septicum]USS00015.1 flagellin [Clostridium septicum]WLF68540.1 flagellin [Clostridium septicum]
MRLNQNIASLNIYKNYKRNLKLQSASLEKISTGNKINKAKDDPNKLGMSEGLRMQIRGIQSAEKNLQDGSSMMQSVEGSLSSITEMLLRMKELVIQGSNGTNSDADLQTIQAEIVQIKENIDFTANTSDFNGVNLLHNENVDNNNYPGYKTHMVGANSGEELQVPLFNISTNILKDKDGNNVKNIDVTDRDKVNKNISAIDSAISIVNDVRSKYGAIQSRMETSYENLISTSSTLQKSESKVRDADIALEMVEYSRTSVLHNSALSILNQSNNFPQDVLRILERIK